MKGLLTLLAALVALGLSPALAQGQRAHPGADPLGDQVFPPEFVMQHQAAIRLTDAQRTVLIAEIKRAQATSVDHHVEMQRAVERLADALKPERPDETQVLAQLDLVLAAEREIKRLHMGLAVRIKGLLSPEQLSELRARRGGGQDKHK